MIYEMEEITDEVKELFKGWEETLIYSCLQQVMGKVFAADLCNPKSAYAFVGCFAFYAGIPNKELVACKPEGFVIMVPSDDEWGRLIEECFPTAKKVTRYAIKKDTVFDREYLKKIVNMLPEGYSIENINDKLYEKCLENPVTTDFVSAFNGKENYLNKGKGIVILKDNEIVAGASSYTRYEGGIEIEVDTRPEERRKHLAMIVCSKLILNCLDEGLYPSWDAQNMNSVKLAQKLGYQFSHEYVAYEVSEELSRHGAVHLTLS